MKREAVLAVIRSAKDDPSQLIGLVEKHFDKGDALDLVEFFQALTKKQHSQLWSCVASLTEDTVQGMVKEGGGEEGGEEVDPVAVSLLECVSVLCHSALAVGGDPVTSDPLLETLQLLHDILLALSAIAPELQNSISQLCEVWWARELPGKEGLVTHCLLYLVARTLADGAMLSDVKRVWGMRQALLLLDFEDTSADSLKLMLLSCTLQPLYIKSEEGHKLLSYLFGLHPAFVQELHQTIKNQIPHSPKQYLQVYGAVYYRAWRLSSGPYLQQLEQHCLQDLMYCTVHAPRVGSHALFHSLRTLLGVFHEQRTQKGVSEALLRLYSPFLWRALKVANPYVRANAAAVLFDAFPLQDPDALREETDLLMQRQFDCMMELLEDPCVLVRVSSVAGVSRVLSYYWEMVPATVIKTLLGKMVKELAWDSTASSVRVAVLQGLCVVLENRLSHPLLRELLPLLSSHLHDTSEKVRIALLDLLLLVKGMRSIKFWHVCPIDHLLARMEVDSVHVGKRTVALLIDSFQPSSGSPSQLMERCITLLKTNPEASRRFYQLAVCHLSVGDVAKFIQTILSTLVQCVEGGEGCEGGEGGATSEDASSDDEEKLEGRDATGVARGGWRREQEAEKTALTEAMESQAAPSPSSSSLPLSEDPELVCGLLETMVVLWEGARDRLDQKKKGSKAARKKLVDRVSHSLPLLFDTFTDSRARSALYILASYLPKKSLSSIANGTLQALASFRNPASVSDYSALLVALVAWQQGGHVIELVNQWLEPVLSDKQGISCEPKVPKKSKGKGKRAGKQAASTAPPPPPPASSSQALLALEMLNWMVAHPACYGELCKLEEFWELSALLRNSMALLEQYCLSEALPEQANQPVSFDVLLNSLSLYFRLCMHKACDSGTTSNTDKLVKHLEEIITWGGRVLLPALKETNFPSTPSRVARQSSRKRKADQPHHPPHPPQLHPVTVSARKMAAILLDIFSDVLLCGAAESSLEMQFATFAGSIADTSSAPSLLHPLTKLLYQLCEVCGRCEVEGIPPPSGGLAPTAVLLERILALALKISQGEHDLFNKTWSQVKQCLSQAVLASVRAQGLAVSRPSSLPPLQAVVSTLLQAIVEDIKKNPAKEVPSNSDDLGLFASSVLKQSCRNAQSARLFASHLLSQLEDTERTLPGALLTHSAALHITAALAAGLGSSAAVKAELVRCMRCSMQIAATLTEEETQAWGSGLTPLIDHVQEILLRA